MDFVSEIFEALIWWQIKTIKTEKIIEIRQHIFD